MILLLLVLKITIWWPILLTIYTIATLIAVVAAVITVLANRHAHPDMSWLPELWGHGW